MKYSNFFASAERVDETGKRENGRSLCKEVKKERGCKLLKRTEESHRLKY